MYHAIPWRLLVHISVCSEWLYIENFFGNKQKRKRWAGKPLNTATKQIMFKVKFCDSKVKKNCTKSTTWMKDKANITTETLAALPMSNTIRMATVKVDQNGNKSNNVCSLPSQISKISDKISQKNQPTEIF